MNEEELTRKLNSVGKKYSSRTTRLFSVLLLDYSHGSLLSIFLLVKVSAMMQVRQSDWEMQNKYLRRSNKKKHWKLFVIRSVFLDSR